MGVAIHYEGAWKDEATFSELTEMARSVSKADGSAVEAIESRGDVFFFASATSKVGTRWVPRKASSSNFLSVATLSF